MTLPVLFLGHGNPVHALADSASRQAWRALAAFRHPAPEPAVQDPGRGLAPA